MSSNKTPYGPYPIRIHSKNMLSLLLTCFCNLSVALSARWSHHIRPDTSLGSALPRLHETARNLKLFQETCSSKQLIVLPSRLKEQQLFAATNLQSQQTENYICPGGFAKTGRSCHSGLGETYGSKKKGSITVPMAEPDAQCKLQHNFLNPKQANQASHHSLRRPLISRSLSAGDV